MCGHYMSHGVCPHGFWQAAVRRKREQAAEGKWDSQPSIIRESRKTRCAQTIAISLRGAFALPALLQKFSCGQPLAFDRRGALLTKRGQAAEGKWEPV